jgi:hypothetical protein
MYHSIADDGPPELAKYRVSCAAFRRQIRLLREEGYDPVTLRGRKTITESEFSISGI